MYTGAVQNRRACRGIRGVFEEYEGSLREYGKSSGKNGMQYLYVFRQSLFFGKGAVQHTS
jgi:hypothetical protein